MSNFSIALYEFENDEIRVVLAEDGQPLFAANDLCKIIGIKNPRQAVSRLDADERGVISTDTPGGEQEMLAVTEPGLYMLVLTSRSTDPRVKRFKRYVTHDLLPAIREHGGYISPDATPDQLQALQARVNTLQGKLENSYQVNYWLAADQGVGRFIENSLPDSDDYAEIEYDNEDDDF